MQVNAFVIHAGRIHWWWIQLSCSVCNQKHLKLIQDARLDGRRRKWPQRSFLVFFVKDGFASIDLVINTYFDSNFEPENLTSNIPTPPQRKGVGMACLAAIWWHLVLLTSAANVGECTRWQHRHGCRCGKHCCQGSRRWPEMMEENTVPEYSPQKKRVGRWFEPPLWWDMLDMLVDTLFVLHEKWQRNKEWPFGKLSQSCEFFRGFPLKRAKQFRKNAHPLPY